MKTYVTLVTCAVQNGGRPHYLCPDCVNPRPVEAENEDHIERGEN